jgi:SET domain-containing protein
VGRYYDYAGRKVLFFALRDIPAGEELLFDYGRAYWRGREALELP